MFEDEIGLRLLYHHNRVELLFSSFDRFEELWKGFVLICAEATQDGVLPWNKQKWKEKVCNTKNLCSCSTTFIFCSWVEQLSTRLVQFHAMLKAFIAFWSSLCKIVLFWANIRFWPNVWMTLWQTQMFGSCFVNKKTNGWRALPWWQG